jgi:glycerol-3-phosphate dehydrogenase
MTPVRRDLASASAGDFDLIVVGGGIYGAALLLEASLRRVKALLLERGDFGGETTRNSLRIGHGGLRYLQRLDITRHRESVAERRWLLSAFPDLVEPLPCLMPLYGEGLRRPSIMRAALGLDTLLSLDRNRGVEASRRLPIGRMISAGRVEALAPGLRSAGLRAGLCWSDAFVPHLPRLVSELLARATDLGATALNYVEATALRRKDDRIEGVEAVDRETGDALAFRSARVVNAAGPRARELARRWDRDHRELFEATLAWNVLLDIAPPFEHALAVAPPTPRARTYFLVPWEGRLFAGTGHAACSGPPARARPTRSELSAFLSDLDAAAPELGIRAERVLRVYAGYLPGRRRESAELAVRPVVLDHGEQGGPRGLWSVSGVKLTTARRVADVTLRRALPGLSRQVRGSRPSPEAVRRRALRRRFGPTWRPEPDGRWREELRALIAEESVLHLGDLILRRTSLGDDPRCAREVALQICEAFEWDRARRDAELFDLEQELAGAAATRDSGSSEAG